MQKFIANHLLNKSILSFLLLPFSTLYSLFQRLSRVIYKLHILKKYKSSIKIISIGNIVSGGTGKTPFTIFLAKYLQNNNKKIAVSHRGYKGIYEKKNKLISDHSSVFSIASKAGDEAYLIAKKLEGTPIIVGKDRTKSIMILEEIYPDLDYIILDDSFQHHKVYHDIDFLIFNSISKIGNGFVLPAGILREPLSAIKDCDFLVVNGEDSTFLKHFDYHKPIINAKYSLDKISDKFGNIAEIDYFDNKKIMLISGIGLPKSFEISVLNSKINFTKHLIFSDHQKYSPIVVSKINDEFVKGDFDLMLTTEKDFAKLQHIDNSLKLFVFELKLVIDDDFSEKIGTKFRI